MRILNAFVAATILSLSTSSFGQASESVQKKCGSLSSGSEIYDCIHNEANYYDKSVTIKESELVKALNEWDLDPEPKNTAIKKFNLAVSQFKIWRKAQCNAQGALALGGSGTDPLYDICRIDIDEFRLIQLEAYKKELDSRK